VGKDFSEERQKPMRGESSMQILRDKNGRQQGVIREIAGNRERLYTPTGKAVADYDGVTRATYDTDRRRIGTGNRLAGMVGEDEE
jgi:hypothetical protein